jgi:serine/threonine-protein kinase RsbW
MNTTNRAQQLNAECWIPSDINRISPWVNWLTHLIKWSGCVPGEETAVELALAEALANAIIHGNRMDPDKRVFVRCCCDPGTGVTIVVRDAGRGFAPREIPDTVEVESEHGRGIFLMKFCMDDVSFEKEGTEVHMRKAATYRPRTALGNTSQVTHRESAFGQSQGANIAEAGQERGETC